MVDVRDNGGRNSNWRGVLPGAFWQWKDGPEHDDFSKLIKRCVEPQGQQQFTKPVALLTKSFKLQRHQ